MVSCSLGVSAGSTQRRWSPRYCPEANQSGPQDSSSNPALPVAAESARLAANWPLILSSTLSSRSPRRCRPGPSHPRPGPTPLLASTSQLRCPRMLFSSKAQGPPRCLALSVQLIQPLLSPCLSRHLRGGRATRSLRQSLGGAGRPCCALRPQETPPSPSWPRARRAAGPLSR